MPVKSLGFDFAMGPVTAVQVGSTAETAGVQVGDKIVAVDGEPVSRALQLPQLIAGKAGKTIELKVERAGADSKAEGAANQQLTFSLKTGDRAMFNNISLFGGVMTLSDLGIAYEVSNLVSFVDPAQVTGDAIRVGDQLAQVRWEPSSEGKEALSELFSAKGMKIVLADQMIDQSLTVASFFDQLQDAPSGMDVRCYFKREGKTVEAVAKVQEASDWFWPQRGLGMKALSEMHRVESFADAIVLGAGETWRRFKEVLSVLRMLATGKLGASGLGRADQDFPSGGSRSESGRIAIAAVLDVPQRQLSDLEFPTYPGAGWRSHDVFDG